MNHKQQPSGDSPDQLDEVFDRLVAARSALTTEQRERLAQKADQTMLAYNAFELGLDYLQRDQTADAMRWLAMAADYGIEEARELLTLTSTTQSDVARGENPHNADENPDSAVQTARQIIMDAHVEAQQLIAAAQARAAELLAAGSTSSVVPADIRGGDLQREVAVFTTAWRRGIDALARSTDQLRLDLDADVRRYVAPVLDMSPTGLLVPAHIQESQAEQSREVFVGLARRNRAQMQRQLRILDEMERTEEDPDRLADLFRLDHLITQARRNVENLITLGSPQSGRMARQPVPFVDVLRGAVAETAEYTRVSVQDVPEGALAGSAAVDTMHLLAELLDNSIAFSPSAAQVRLYGGTVIEGVVLEVEDRGIGMSEADRERYNAVLENPPDFGAAAVDGGRRLGLFVAAKLAAKHGIRVVLRPCSNTGTRAIVLIPATLIIDANTVSSPLSSVIDKLGGARRGSELPSRRPRASLVPQSINSAAFDPSGLDTGRLGARPDAETAPSPSRDDEGGRMSMFQHYVGRVGAEDK